MSNSIPKAAYSISAVLDRCLARGSADTDPQRKPLVETLTQYAESATADDDNLNQSRKEVNNPAFQPISAQSAHYSTRRAI